MLASKNLKKLNEAAVAVAIACVWFVVMSKVGDWALFNLPLGYNLFVQHLTGVAVLLAVIPPYHRWMASLEWGRAWQRTSLLPAVAVLAVYSLEHVFAKFTGQPPETWVEEVLSRPPWQLLSVFVTILLLGPVSEEIVFRGVLLNLFRTSRPWTLWAGIVFTALLFAAVHPQYHHLSTLIELMSLSLIYGWARLRSGGMALPILLHSFSSALAVIFTWFG